MALLRENKTRVEHTNVQLEAELHNCMTELQDMHQDYVVRSCASVRAVPYTCIRSVKTSVKRLNKCGHGCVTHFKVERYISL